MVTSSLLSPISFYRWKSKIVFVACTVTMHIAVSEQFYSVGSYSINVFIDIHVEATMKEPPF